MSDEAKAALLSKRELRVEYDAEFEPGAEAGADLARIESEPRSLSQMLGASQRELVQRLTLEFVRKLGSMEAEVAEMMSREIALKQAAADARAHNMRLGEERDRLAAMVDPQGEMRRLREENAQLAVRLQGVVEQRDAALRKMHEYQSTRPRATVRAPLRKTKPRAR